MSDSKGAPQPLHRRFPPARVALIAVAAAVAAFLVWLAWRPRADDRDVLTGYIQADSLYLSSPVAGPVGQVMVVRGQRVSAGAPVFSMDLKTLRAGRDAAAAKTALARAGITQQQADVEKARAQLAAAEATARNARDDYARNLAVQKDRPGAVSRQQIDAARAAAGNAAAQRDAAAREVVALIAQAAGAKAQLGENRATLTQVQTQLDQLSQSAPAPGRIEDVMFQSGEWAPANQPVVSLIPDSKVKVRFYVPQPQVSRYRFGRVVHFSCDGCPLGLSAAIDFVSTTPEYTPPIIYSRKMRAKLVFMVEARPAAPRTLAPGLPVDVEPLK